MKKVVKRLTGMILAFGLATALTSGAEAQVHVHEYTFIYDPPLFWGYCYDFGCLGGYLCCFVLEE